MVHFLSFLHHVNSILSAVLGDKGWIITCEFDRSEVEWENQQRRELGYREDIELGEGG
jgi:hypothetical protein